MCAEQSRSLSVSCCGIEEVVCTGLIGATGALCFAPPLLRGENYSLNVEQLGKVVEH